MSKRHALLVSVFVAVIGGCVFESGPELSGIPPFQPSDMSENNQQMDADMGALDAADTGDMRIAGDMPVRPDMRPDMADPPDMSDPMDMMVRMDTGDDPDMMLPGPFGDVCPGQFNPPPTAPEDCDLILQDCPPGPMGAGTNCDVALIQNPPNPEFAPLCLLDGVANFVLDEGQACDPASSTTKCRKGLECSQVNGERVCRRFCILEDARGCDPGVIPSSCAPTGMGALDSIGVGYCAARCDAFR